MRILYTYASCWSRLFSWMREQHQLRQHGVVARRRTLLPDGFGRDDQQVEQDKTIARNGQTIDVNYGHAAGGRIAD